MSICVSLSFHVNSVLRTAYARRKVRQLLWAAWLGLKGRRRRRALRIRKSLPTTLADWQVIIDRAGKVGPQKQCMYLR